MSEEEKTLSIRGDVPAAVARNLTRPYWPALKTLNRKSYSHIIAQKRDSRHRGHKSHHVEKTTMEKHTQNQQVNPHQFDEGERHTICIIKARKIGRKKNGSEVKVPKKPKEHILTDREKAIEVIFSLWQNLPGGVKHRITRPLSKTVIKAKELIGSTLSGNFQIPHPSGNKSRKYSVRDWKLSFSRFSKIFEKPEYSSKTLQWAKKLSLVNFIKNDHPVLNNDEIWNLRALSPFLYFLHHEMPTIYETQNKIRTKFSNDDVEKVFELFDQYSNDAFSRTIENKKIMMEFIKRCDRFISFNSYGLDKYYSNIQNLSELFFENFVDGKVIQKLSYLLWNNIWENFFAFCLDEQIINDEKDGKLYGPNGDLYWFQLEEVERNRIRKQEKLEQEELEKIKSRNKKKVLIKKKMSISDAKCSTTGELNRRAEEALKDLYNKKRTKQRKEAVGFGIVDEFDSVWREMCLKYKINSDRYERFDNWYTNRVKELYDV